MQIIVIDFNLVLLHKIQKIGLIIFLSADNIFKDLNFVFQHFKLLLTTKTPLVDALYVSSSRKCKGSSCSSCEEDNREAEFQCSTITSMFFDKVFNKYACDDSVLI